MIATLNFSYISPKDYLQTEETNPTLSHKLIVKDCKWEHPVLEDLPFLGKCKGK